LKILGSIEVYVQIAKKKCFSALRPAVTTTVSTIWGRQEIRDISAAWSAGQMFILVFALKD